MIRFEEGLCDHLARARGAGLLVGSALLTAAMAILVLTASASCHG